VWYRDKDISLRSAIEKSARSVRQAVCQTTFCGCLTGGRWRSRQNFRVSPIERTMLDDSLSDRSLVAQRYYRIHFRRAPGGNIDRDQCYH
jgi:hypothetical protein